MPQSAPTVGGGNNNHHMSGGGGGGGADGADAADMGIKGMIAVVGNSDLLERSIVDLGRFIEKNKQLKAEGKPELDAVDEMGFGSIKDGLTPDEAISRLEMMFSRGLIRAVSSTVLYECIIFLKRRLSPPFSLLYRRITFTP